MDIRVVDNGIELSECEKLTKEELAFLLLLANTGEYWELRDNGDIYTLHDKNNYKYKGTIEELKRDIE